MDYARGKFKRQVRQTRTPWCILTAMG